MMVKNTKGGNKHKKMARKSNAPTNQEKYDFHLVKMKYMLV